MLEDRRSSKRRSHGRDGHGQDHLQVQLVVQLAQVVKRQCRRQKTDDCQPDHQVMRSRRLELCRPKVDLNHDDYRIDQFQRHCREKQDRQSLQAGDDHHGGLGRRIVRSCRQERRRARAHGGELHQTFGGVKETVGCQY